MSSGLKNTPEVTLRATRMGRKNAPLEQGWKRLASLANTKKKGLTGNTPKRGDFATRYKKGLMGSLEIKERAETKIPRGVAINQNRFV